MTPTHAISADEARRLLAEDKAKRPCPRCLEHFPTDPPTTVEQCAARMAAYEREAEVAK